MAWSSTPLLMFWSPLPIVQSPDLSSPVANAEHPYAPIKNPPFLLVFVALCGFFWGKISSEKRKKINQRLAQNRFPVSPPPWWHSGQWLARLSAQNPHPLLWRTPSVRQAPVTECGETAHGIVKKNALIPHNRRPPRLDLTELHYHLHSLNCSGITRVGVTNKWVTNKKPTANSTALAQLNKSSSVSSDTIIVTHTHPLLVLFASQPHLVGYQNNQPHWTVLS